MGFKKKLGDREWGISPLGERIYHVGYCSKCVGKCFLCEQEFRRMLEDVGWEITRCTFWHFVEKKYNIKIPKIRIEWGIKQGLDTRKKWEYT